MNVFLKPRAPLPRSATTASNLSRLNDWRSPDAIDPPQGETHWQEFTRLITSDPATALPDQLSKFKAWAVRVAATRFPTFVSLTVCENPFAQSKGISRQTSTSAESQTRVERIADRDVYPLVSRGLYAAAIAQLDRLKAEAKPSRDQLQLVLTLKAQLYYSLNETQTSVKLLDEAISLDRDSTSAFRAQSAKNEVARLLQFRAPHRAAERASRAATTKPRTAPFGRLSAPTVLAIRSAAVSRAYATLGAGLSAASQFRR